MRRSIRDHSLTIVTLGFFLVFLIGQILTGYRVSNADRLEMGEDELSYRAYLHSGHVVEATFENWESEFLQMGAYVLFTAFLIQRGSAESRDPDASGDDRETPSGPDAPWPVRHGGWVLALYRNSLPAALLAIFAVSFLLHAWGGARVYSEEQLARGGHAWSTWDYLHTSQFWFESFQNWQSEFLAVGSLVVLSIFLRQHDSPESKPVSAPHTQTGA